VVRQRVGYQLFQLQCGGSADDFKVIGSVGPGTYEIRVDDEFGKNVGRCLYVTKFKSRIYVLHAFVKKSQRTPKKNISLGRSRYKKMISHIQKLKKV